jgi:phenylalanyl-tRNA synthetase alpha chain
MKIPDLQKQLGSVFGPAMGLAKKNNWVESKENELSLKTYPSNIPGEKTLKQIGKSSVSKQDIDKEDLQSLMQRPEFIIENLIKTKQISLTKKAQSLDISDSDSGAIDVEAKVPEVFVARTHPLKDTIDEIREIFVTLGFTEIFGNLAQPSFWNFDALFTPQDHPARELQDTFYLDGVSSKKIGTPDQIRKVSESHKKGWRYYWDINEARKMVLRTHTTCVTIKHLAENKSDEARVFSLGRVFRNEKVSYKHLVEFNQIEGVVVGSNANLRNLMGIQREFYRRIGITKIKFWPTFFPYTEPSLQTMVYNERLGKWVELFGMGIFRPEVTKPLGITKPVLAWGGGIERIAMLKYGLDDVREFYNNNLNWLRSATKCQ